MMNYRRSFAQLVDLPKVSIFILRAAINSQQKLEKNMKRPMIIIIVCCSRVKSRYASHEDYYDEEHKESR